MKKILLFVLLLLSSFIFSQESAHNEVNVGTTLEEYNYLTKGYKIQIESGLDMKKGYYFDYITTLKKGNYSFEYNILFRERNNEIAGISIKAYSNVSGKTYYLCMPVKNFELSKNFENTISNWDESMTTAFANATSQLFANMLFSYNTEIKKTKK